MPVIDVNAELDYEDLTMMHSSCRPRRVYMAPLDIDTVQVDLPWFLRAQGKGGFR